jgi:hypothetical protein
MAQWELLVARKMSQILQYFCFLSMPLTTMRRLLVLLTVLVPACCGGEVGFLGRIPGSLVAVSSRVAITCQQIY